MAESSTEERVCSGCGAALQSTDEAKPGYVPSAGLVRSDPLCRRCFRIQNYGEFSRALVSTAEYERLVGSIAKVRGTVLYVLDVFDLSGSIIPNLARYIGSNDVIAVVNKVDLLPREVDPDTLGWWVREELEKSGVHVREVLFVSAQSGLGADTLVDALDSAQVDRVYVVGMANVGKSSLLNRILRDTGGTQRFTTSKVPGTTLGLTPAHIHLPSSRSLEVMDTPGLIHGNRVTDKLCPNCLKRAVPEQRLKPRVYQLNPGQTLFIGGFARFDFAAGAHQPIVCYVSNQLVVHRTKLERADAIYEQHADDILKTPCPSCRAELGGFRRIPVLAGRFARTGSNPSPHSQSERIECGRKGCDIVLSGLGWISLFGRDLRGALWSSESAQVTMRPRLIGDVSRKNENNQTSREYT